MTALIHAQVVQLRTLRSTYLVAGSLVALVALITGITMGEAGSADLRTEAQLREPLVASAGIMVAVVMAIFAATRVAGEYRHATIAQRVLASPQRPRLVAATLLVHATLAALVTAAAFALGAAIAAPLLASKDLSTGLAGGELAQVGAAVVLAGTMFTLLGAAVGFLTRSQAPAVVTLFAVFFAEKLIGPALGPVGDYLPYALLNSLLELDGPLSVGVAALALTTTAAALCCLAATTVARRDIA
jgi:ABC-type transport system involved in multi-copper enzyme maturation permease subunit